MRGARPRTTRGSSVAPTTRPGMCRSRPRPIVRGRRSSASWVSVWSCGPVGWTCGLPRRPSRWMTIRRACGRVGSSSRKWMPARSCDGGEIELEAGGERIRCARLVVAADAWTNGVLAMLGIEPWPLTLTREQVVYLACADPEVFAPERFPIWIWMDDPSFYGFPSFGEPAPKVAQDVGGPEIPGPDARGDDADPSALQRVIRFVEEHLPAAAGPVHLLRTCVYTLPPDRDFVLGAVPGHPSVLVALGAAHGFKFASLFGRILADLAIDGCIDGSTSHDLSAFAPDRPILGMTDPPRSFLI